MFESNHKSTVTIWALGPYLVVYRTLGLIPICFDVDISSLVCNYRLCQWTRRIKWSTLYSVAISLLMATFLVENRPSLELFLSLDNDQILEATNKFSIAFNVCVTLIVCLFYLGRRVNQLVDKMVRCEQDLATFECHLDVNRLLFKTAQQFLDSLGNSFFILMFFKRRLAFHCWLALFVGIATAVTNEFAVNWKYFGSTTNATRDANSTGVSHQTTRPDIFRAIATPLVAGIWMFVDLSVVHFSLIFSCYQRQLVKKIDHWSLLDLNTKERVRLTYWSVQALIKVRFGQLK